MINKADFSLEEFSDGSVCLQCDKSKGMEGDLVFASGAMRGDPDLKNQREILEFIMKALQYYEI